MSVFFQSIIRQLRRAGNRFSLMRFCLNVVYGFILSCLLGLLISLALYIFVDSRLNADIYSQQLLWLPIPGIFWICFIVIALINFHHPSFSWPRHLYILFIVPVLLNTKKQYFKAASYLFGVTMLIFILSTLYIANLFSTVIVNESELRVIAVFSSSFSILLSVILFSYGAVNEIQRLYGKFVLWSILVIIMMGYTMTQLINKINVPFNQTIAAEIILSIMGLIFAIISVLDKGEELVNKLVKTSPLTLMRVWRKYERLYSSKRLIYRFKNQLLDLVIFRLLWKDVNKMRFFSFTVSFIAAYLILVYFTQLFSKWGQDVAPQFMNYLSSHIYLSTNLQGVVFVFFIAIFLTFISIKQRSHLGWHTAIIGMSFSCILILFSILLLNHYYFMNEIIDKILRTIALLIFCFIGLLFLIEIVLKMIHWLRN